MSLLRNDVYVINKADQKIYRAEKIETSFVAYVKNPINKTIEKGPLYSKDTYRLFDRDGELMAYEHNEIVIVPQRIVDRLVVKPT